MEEIVFDAEGMFHERVSPLIDACAVVSINSYPMDNRAWFTFDAFEESRRFPNDSRVVTIAWCALRRACGAPSSNWKGWASA